MKQKNLSYDTVLCGEEIDIISEKLKDYLAGIKADKRDIIRYSLSAEEILIKSLDAGNGGRAVKLRAGKRFARNYITLEINGESNNVYISDDTEQSVLGLSILKNLGISPEYSYSSGNNIYAFTCRRKRINPVVSLVAALLLGFLIGALGYFLPQKAVTATLGFVLNPLNDTFLNILGCLAGPMVFLSVAWGIYGIGDAVTLKRVGKKILSGYLGTVFVTLFIISAAVFPIFRLNLGGSFGSGKEMSSVIEMLLGIIPKNIVSPFADGNTLQIIFLAIVIGIAMLFLGKKTKSVALAVEQINYIVQFIIEFISRLVPYFVFIIIVKLLWSNGAEIFIGVWEMFFIYLGGVAVMAVIVVIYSAVKNRVNPFSLIKKGLPTLLVALSTASSAAAFGVNISACREEYGINDSISSFGIPLGMVIFKPATAISYMVMSFFFAQKFGVQISLSWIAVMFLTSALLSVATPPIPGGALTAYTVLFAQLGIPAEALAIALACDTVYDFVNTGFDQFLLPIILLNQSEKMGMLNREILTRKAKGK